MKFNDLINSLTSYAHERANSPFVWVFITCFTLKHWTDFLVLFFSEQDMSAKIAHIELSISKSSYLFGMVEKGYAYISEPLISAIIISLIYPILAMGSSYVSEYFSTQRNVFMQSFDKKKFLTREQSVAFKEEREGLIETFHKQLSDSQKQLQETQTALIESRANSSVYSQVHR